ncbi:hypothetical protein ACTFIV_006969 [Dictyostelium citrinum]
MLNKLITPQLKNYKNFSNFSMLSFSRSSPLFNNSNKNFSFISNNKNNIIKTKDYQISKSIINNQFTIININRYYSTINNQNQVKDMSSSTSSTSTKPEVVSSISNTETINNNDISTTIDPTTNPIFNNNNENNKTLLDKIMKNTYEYPRYSKQWWIEKAYIFTIFGITGTSSLHVVKFLLKNLFGYPQPISIFEGGLSLVSTDPKYVFIYFLTMYTVYPFILISYGTLFGRYQYFVKLFNRMSVFSQLKRLFTRLPNKNLTKKD